MQPIKHMNVITLDCGSGELFDFYIVEYFKYTPGQDMSISKSVLIRSPEGMSAAVRAHMLVKEGKLSEGWSRIRPANEKEVEWWKEKHKTIDKSNVELVEKKGEK